MIERYGSHVLAGPERCAATPVAMGDAAAPVRPGTAVAGAATAGGVPPGTSGDIPIPDPD